MADATLSASKWPNSWPIRFEVACQVDAHWLRVQQPETSEMKPMKIAEENKSFIQQELDRVNGKASQSVMSSAEVVSYADKAEVRLLGLVGVKKHAAGATFTARSGSPVSRAYRYSRTATEIKMERRKSGWWLVDISRCQLNSYQGGETSIAITTAQDLVSVNLLRAKYSVLQPEASRRTTANQQALSESI